jgi:peptide/nickel transport system ATP-binding protein
MSGEPLLSVRDLAIAVRGDEGEFRAVDGVSFEVREGELFGVVGESGCGKSLTVLSIPGLLPHGIARVVQGQAMFEGIDLYRATPRQRRAIVGKRIGTIFQEPGTSLNPVLSIGTQIAEVVRTHFDVGPREARDAAREMLEKVAIPDPAHRLDQYPHELSGGLRQRAMIALALVCKPRLLIADEPTTALDVTIQAQILRLLRQLQQDTGTAIILVTHDLGIISQYSDRLMVMYAGKSVEAGNTAEVLGQASHPYTRGLLACSLGLDDGSGTLPTIRGSVPALSQLGRGCRFAERCDIARTDCAACDPGLLAIARDHVVACPYWSDRGHA